ncbi:nuclear transport factor 2 family protein [Streptomyces sp. NPDC058953]|uniref:nuclear transport factor 2 family protein n=1 Tax=unclassified Streptomyces TaxID=2593676 RepID=UPI0036A44AF0
MNPTTANTTTPEAVEAAGTAATRAVVEEFLARLGQGPEAIAELYAEEVDWYIAPNPDVPWIKPRSTRADIADHYRELAAGQENDPAGTRFDAVVVTGPDAVVVGTLAGTVRATGIGFQSPFALHFTVANGLIVRFRVIEDSLAVAAACAPDRA